MGLGEWTSYGLADFLLFSDRVYWRMFVRYNAAMWPAQTGTIAAGVLMLLGLLRSGAGAGRMTLAGLALLWVLVAWLFFIERYQAINWAAIYIAPAFAFQAGLLAMLAAGREPPALSADRRAGDWRAGNWLAAAVFVFAVAGWPFIASFAGRDWQSAEVFGLAPDPTAVATVAIAALMASPGRWLVMVVPLVWCFASGLTLYVLGAPDFFIAPALGGIAAACGLVRGKGISRPGA